MPIEEKRRYRRILLKNGRSVQILFEYDPDKKYTPANVVDQSEGGAQFLAGRGEVREGAFAIIKAASGWPLPEKRATARVVWADRDGEKTRFGCEYLSPMTGVPNFF
ncbi:MAG: PilZ domain-containing protein [Candidatus Nitrospinota bacterium M3_3B_026]